MSFLDSETQAKMESSLGLTQEEDPLDDAVVEDEGSGAESPGDDSSEAEVDETPAESADVKPPVSGWVPRSRLNQQSERIKAHEATIAELRQAQSEYEGRSQQQQILSEAPADDFDALIKDIWGDNPPESPDTAMLSHVQKLQGDLDGMKTARQEREVQAIRDGWAKDVEEISTVFANEHGIDDPALGRMIMNEVYASQGATHPHEAAEKILQFVHGLTKREAKELVAEAKAETGPPASPRGSTGRSSKGSAPKKSKSYGSIAKASEAAAAAMGVEW